MADKDMFDFLNAKPAAPAPAPAPAAPQAEAPAEPEPAAKLPLPKQVRELLLSPPEGCDAMAQLKAFGLQYEIHDDLLSEIVEAGSPSYTAEQLAAIAAQLPQPEPAAAPEPDPQPLAKDDAPAAKPAPKKRGRRSTTNPKDGDPLTRAERLALACAMIQAGGPMATAEAAAEQLDAAAALVIGEA